MTNAFMEVFELMLIPYFKTYLKVFCTRKVSSNFSEFFIRAEASLLKI